MSEVKNEGTGYWCSRFIRIKFCKRLAKSVRMYIWWTFISRPQLIKVYEVVQKPNVEFFALNGR